MVEDYLEKSKIIDPKQIMMPEHEDLDATGAGNITALVEPGSGTAPEMRVNVKGLKAKNVKTDSDGKATAAEPPSLQSIFDRQ